MIPHFMGKMRKSTKKVIYHVSCWKGFGEKKVAVSNHETSTSQEMFQNKISSHFNKIFYNHSNHGD